MRATELSRRMARLVRAWERSGEPRGAFARRHGLTVSQFDYWKRRVRRAAVAPAFVPVQVLPESPAPPAAAGAAIELALPGGARLTIPDGVSATTLQTVLTAVRTAC